MSDLKLETDSRDAGFGDLIIVGGDLVMVTGKEAILQNVMQRLRVFAGEWFLDTTRGLPYYQQIMVKNPDQGQIDALYINEILGTPGVVGLNSFQSTVDFAARTLSIRFSAQTTDGVVNYSGLLSAA